MVFICSALIDIQEIALFWDAVLLKNSIELSTRSIYMIVNMISVIGKFLFVLIFWPWRSQQLAAQSTRKIEHEPTQPIDQFLRFVIFFSFSENRLRVLVEFSIDWYSRKCLNLGCCSAKHPNELSTRSIYMIANLISVTGKLLFVLIFWPWRSQ